MKQILKPNNIIVDILGEQKYSNDNEYRFIMFHHVLKINEGILLFNFLTNEMIFLSNTEIKNIKSSKRDELYIKLVNNWFLVPIKNNDIKLYEQYEKISNIIMSNLKVSRKGFIDTYTILTTTDCNARCFYCFELGRKRSFMSENTAQDVAKYIINHCDNKLVKLRWFGGEPLYNYKVIDIICNSLKRNNIDYISNMITNGYLLNKQMIQNSKKWNLKRVQITLDGTQEVYNRCKAFIYKNANAFAIVTDNIESALDANIDVHIRINMGLHNVDDLYMLVDYLADRYGKYENFSLYPHLLYENTENNEYSFNDKKKLIEQFINLENYIEKKDLFRYTMLDNKIRVAGCMAGKDNTTVVMPNGELGKCEYFTESKFWGNIYSDDINYSKINEFKFKRNYFNQCDLCAYRPLCNQNKACPHAVKNCDELDRKMTFKNFEKYMFRTYQNYCKGISNKFKGI